VAKSDWEKWLFLKSAPARDAESEEVQAAAQSLWAVASLSVNPRWAFIELAQAVARDLIRYVLDSDRVGREQIDGFTDPYGSPLAPLEHGADDCDAKARLFVALCLARRIRAEMVPGPGESEVRAGARLKHVSARVWTSVPVWDPKTKTITESREQWLEVETILARAKVGEKAEKVPAERDTGNWLFS
jgi:transglutaminase-like putative cysteine protease